MSLSSNGDRMAYGVPAVCVTGFRFENVTHQRAGAIRVDFKTDPTAGSVACDCYVANIGGLVAVIAVSIDPSHDRTWILVGDHDCANISATAR